MTMFFAFFIKIKWGALLTKSLNNKMTMFFAFFIKIKWGALTIMKNLLLGYKTKLF